MDGREYHGRIKTTDFKRCGGRRGGHHPRGHVPQSLYGYKSDGAHGKRAGKAFPGCEDHQGTDFQTGYIDPEVYSAETHSFSLEKSYTLRVSKKYLDGDDVVLLVDDILSNGQAILSLLELVSKAGGEVAGVGVAIEKAMRDGGRVLRRMGIRVEALATVERIEGDRIILKD